MNGMTATLADTKRAVAYVRVSSASQVEGHSLDAQERLFHELCKTRGWKAVEVYRDEGKSAYSDSIRKRPEFRRLLDDSAKGVFDVVVVHTLDRWARNARIAMNTLAILDNNRVDFMSITESFDNSTPQGKLLMQMVSSFAQYFSDSLGTHVSKGLSQRAIEGKHTGGLPFGYESCWVGDEGERKRRCKTEHPGGVHLHESEAGAVRELFGRYTTGMTTLAELAVWLNDEGFRTRNTRRLPDPDGKLVAGPRLFTTASVRGILHNAFYTGIVKHKGETYQGAHNPIVNKEMFDLVQDTLRKNSGRSMTLTKHPQREYLLKGIVRCAWCRMPMWAQTYKNGRRYYREHRNSRSIANCPSHGGSIPCETADEQMGKIVEAIELGPRWEEEVLAIMSVGDEITRVEEKRQKTREKLRRLGKAYVGGLYDDLEFQRQKALLEQELESLVVPEADAAEEAGRLIEQLPELWSEATPQERRKLLLTMLDAVYVDAKEERRIVALKVKAPFKPIFEVATMREDSGIVLANEKDLEDRDQPAPHGQGAQAKTCSWWRRGRVELHLKRGNRTASRSLVLASSRSTATITTSQDGSSFHEPRP